MDGSERRAMVPPAMFNESISGQPAIHQRAFNHHILILDDVNLDPAEGPRGACGSSKIRVTD